MTGLLSRLSIALIQATAGWSPAARTRLGRWLGGLLWTLARARRRIALTNLQLCFPEKSAEERHALARACFDNLARGLIDHGVLACAALPAVERFIRIEGQEYLRAVHGKPLILVAPHFVGLDAGAVRLSIIGRGASIYARQRNAQWDRWLRLIRTRSNAASLSITCPIRTTARNRRSSCRFSATRRRRFRWWLAWRG
jgi:KDO2-lipid IV(A) lauroyltransferase